MGGVVAGLAIIYIAFLLIVLCNCVDVVVSFTELTHHSRSAPNGSEYRITVPVSDPENARAVVELACVLADETESATVRIAHVVQAVPKMNIN